MVRLLDSNSTRMSCLILPLVKALSVSMDDAFQTKRRCSSRKKMNLDSDVAQEEVVQAQVAEDARTNRTALTSASPKRMKLKKMTSLQRRTTLSHHRATSKISKAVMSRSLSRQSPRRGSSTIQTSAWRVSTSKKRERETRMDSIASWAIRAVITLSR